MTADREITSGGDPAHLASTQIGVESPAGLHRVVTVESDNAFEVAGDVIDSAGVTVLRISAPAIPETAIDIRFSWPLGPAVTIWQPESGSRRVIQPNWNSSRRVRSMRSAAVASLVSPDDSSPLTVSLSSNVRSCDFGLSVSEESAECEVAIRIRSVEPVAGQIEFTLRLDVRGEHFADALAGVTDVWTRELAQRIPPVPAVAYEPMFSTWYSDHQHVSAASVEKNAQDARDLGCRTIIVDDGWQTDDTRRGYAYCGDWEPTRQAFERIVEHVARVHDLGLTYLLWIAPAFMGVNADAWPDYRHLTLSRDQPFGAAVLDPRFPQVRSRLVDRCIRPLRDWGVDGLKIDFVDAWDSVDEGPIRADMDCDTVDEGVERFLAAVAHECRLLRGELLIEFRQDYVSPRLWQYGTMIRAGDCPMDATENRARTIDTRLLSGTRAVHADMLMWHPDASAAEVAAQFIAVLFSTIQISMTLSALSENHRRVLKFWLDFSITHRETLLHGRLLPSHPEARYSQVTAYRGGTTIIVAYVESLVTVDDPFPTELVLVNGCGHAGLVLKTPSRGRVSVEMFGPDGTRVSQTETVLNGAPVIVDVPVSGVAFIRCAN